MTDLGYSGAHDPIIQEIARDFLRQILPLDGQIILPKPYIRDGISENEVLEAWSKTFGKLESIGRDTDVCLWLTKVEHQWKHRDNRLDVFDAWNDLFFDWCLKPDKYPELPFPETTIQRLRIENLVYRVRVAELQIRINIAKKSDNADAWDSRLLEDKLVDTWVHNIARLEYAITKWISIFTILSYDDLEILENTWGESVIREHVAHSYFSLIGLWEFCKSNGYI